MNNFEESVEKESLSKEDGSLEHVRKLKVFDKIRENKKLDIL